MYPNNYINICYELFINFGNQFLFTCIALVFNYKIYIYKYIVTIKNAS